MAAQYASEDSTRHKGSSSRNSSKSSVRSDASLGDASPANGLLGDVFCGACCITRPKGVKVKRLRAMEYATLLEAMDVDEFLDDSLKRAFLSPFLARFPHALHPLMKPFFFLLGHGAEQSMDENSIDWLAFVETLSRISHGSGATWIDILQAFENATVESSVRSAVINAACLCFYFAHPYLAHSPDDVLTGLAPPGTSDSVGCNDSWIRSPPGIDCGSERMKIDKFLEVLDETLAKAEDADDGIVKRVSSRVLECDLGSIETVARWLEGVVPCLPFAISSQLANTLMGTPLRRHFPVVDSEILDVGSAFLLRGTSAELWDSEPWNLLFSDRRDGRSFSGFLASVQHYLGTLVMVIRTMEGEVLGAVSKYWSDGNGEFGGGPDCYLFALAPALTVNRVVGPSNFSYVNYKNRSKTRGLGFGGNPEWFRFFVDDFLTNGYVTESDMTYQKSKLLPGNEFKTEFKVASLEIWGCGGLGTQDEQNAMKRRVSRAAQGPLIADKSSLVQSAADADLFFPNTFGKTKDAREVSGVIDGHRSPKGSPPSSSRPEKKMEGKGKLIRMVSN